MPGIALISMLAGCSGGAGAAGPSLQVRFIGVGGYHLRVGDDALLTAPLLSNPPGNVVFLREIYSDRALVDQFIGDVSDARAILVGHAHYDHLLDVPQVWTHTDDAVVYGNLSAKRLMDAYAPDPPGCPDAVNPDWALLPRDRVVALNDPNSNVVDYRQCGGVKTCGSGSGEGSWVEVEGTHIRFKALCSEHPPQSTGLEFGLGCVTESRCDPEPKADEWRQGTTLAYLIDFRSAGGDILHRVYYQDAPTHGPIGYPHADDLDEHGIDVALLNAGSYDQIPDYPAGFIAANPPSHVILGHWENFFANQNFVEANEPYFGMDIDTLRGRMDQLMPGPGQRWWMPVPGDQFVFGGG